VKPCVAKIPIMNSERVPPAFDLAQSCVESFQDSFGVVVLPQGAAKHAPWGILLFAFGELM